MKLNNLKPAFGSIHSKKRVGRGRASGQGTTAGRGYKGQGSRTGSGYDSRFEGGQTPLYRRLPKIGFTSPFRQPYTVVHFSDLMKFSEGSTVDLDALKKARLVKGKGIRVKVLGCGDISKKLNFRVHAFSESAKKKIEAAGGTAEVI